MTCDDFKKQLAMAVLGIGSPDELRELESHADSCRTCAERMEKARRAQAAIAEPKIIPLPDWEVSWQVIEAQALRKKRPNAFFTLRNRWALAAGLVVIVVLSALAGRYFFNRPKPAAPSDVFAGMSPESAWRGYADRLELILVDFGNRADVEPPRNIVKQEKVLIERILAETRVLKSILASEGDEARLSLLNDAERLLAKIASLRPGDKTSEQNVAKVVRESPLKARLRTIVSSEPIL